MSASPSSSPAVLLNPPLRCIAHIDMDCFYAQVEAVRLGIDCRTTPFACVQWGSFIAVNYPARARGVRRFRQTPAESLRAVPELQTAHIATCAAGKLQYGHSPAPHINTHMVSLEPYRHASRQIFVILRSEPGVIVGKAGIDEAYVDVTEAAVQELVALRCAERTGDDAVPLDALTEVMEPSTRLIADRSAEMEAWFGEHGASLESVYDAPMRALRRGEVGREVEGSRGFCVGAEAQYEARCLLLCAATRVVHRLRQRIRAELHYDCSAGIAHNRVLAKCISATHKPNQQTLLLPDRSASALFDLPLRELRGFGGKFGAAVKEVCGGAAMCRDLWLVPLAQLLTLDGNTLGMSAVKEDDDIGGDGEEVEGGEGNSNHHPPPSGTRTSTSNGVGGVGEYTFFRLRGVGTNRVADPAVPRAFSAGKIFHPCCSSWEMLQEWMAPLAGELWNRFREVEPLYMEEGRHLVLYASTYTATEERRRSRSFRHVTVLPTVITGAAQLEEMALQELAKLQQDLVPGLEQLHVSSTKNMAQRTASVVTTADREAAVTPNGAPPSDNMKAEKEEEKPIMSTVSASLPPSFPPLRTIGLTISALRLRGTGPAEGEAGAATAHTSQRSLKDMFATICAQPKKTKQLDAAADGRKRIREEEATAEDMEKVFEIEENGGEREEREDLSMSASVDGAADAALFLHAVGAQVNSNHTSKKTMLSNAQTGSVRSGRKVGIDARCATLEDVDCCAPAAPPAVVLHRRTLEDFFQRAPVKEPSKERVIATVRGSCSNRTSPPPRWQSGSQAVKTVTSDAVGDVTHTVGGSLSVVEISSDEDDVVR